jgi:polyvinyl alcohol dehydrogenase (cytochrome)
MRNVILILGMCGWAAGVSATQTAADGEQIYTANCARCHDGTLPRMPSRDALQERSARQIQTAITSGVMRQFGGPLSASERRAVAEFLSGDPAGTLDSPVPSLPASAYCDAGVSGAVDLGAPAWNGWGAGLENRRFQTADAAGMTADDVAGLSLKWAFGFPGVTDTGSQTTVVAGRALVGTRNGLVYALDAASGCVHWVHEAPSSVRSAISVGPADGGGHTAYFGDAFASVHAVDLMTGDLRWTTKVDDHAISQITGAPALHEGRLYVPVSSLEEVSAADPRYECCTFRGSVVALDAGTGEQIWKTFVIQDEPVRTRVNAAGAQNWAPSGAGIWSAPTLDPDRNLLYVATGARPVTPTRTRRRQRAMRSWL